MMKSKSVAIIGGGYTGLACAYSLAKQGIAVTIYERENVLGGLARGFICDGWNWSVERYYHHWFASDRVLLRFCLELGVEREVVFKSPKTVMQTVDGNFSQLDSAIALLLYKDLKFLDRLRMGLALAYLKVARNWKSLENETAESWCRRFMGNAGFNAIWRPLLEGKFGQYAGQVNMAWLWARIHSRTAQLGSFKGGFQKFTDCLAFKCRELGVDIKTKCSDIEINYNGSQWDVSSGRKIVQSADAVVVAAGPDALKQIYKPLQGEIDSHARPALGAVVVLLSLKKQIANPSEAYWFSLRKEGGKPFLAAIDHSRFIDKKEFSGETLVYFADYLETTSAEWKQSSEEFYARALTRLLEIDGSFTQADVLRHWVFKDAYAQPIPLVDASQKLPRTQYENGLYHASIAHVYPWDRGTNYALELGENIALQVSKNFAKSRELTSAK